MRIGIQLIAYNSEGVLEELIAPWLRLKDKYDLKVWVGSGQFKTYNQMGCENLNGPTIKLLEGMMKEGKIDYLFQPDPDNLLDDSETRDKCIPWMKEQDIDLMIQVDSDEFYTEEEVENLITFIEENPQPSVYNVVFNNIVGDSREDWVRFAVGWIKRHGGIKNYYFDCHFSFSECEYRDAPNITVPKTLVHPTHSTWTNNKNTTGPSHIREKIDYQNRIYGGDVGVTRCGMIWDDEEQKIKKIGEVDWGYKINKIDFLKTDCKGGEYNIFKVENICWLKENMKKCSGEWHLVGPEKKKKFREFRDVFLRIFPNHEVYSVDGINIKWDLWNEHFIEYYNQVIIHINNEG